MPKSYVKGVLRWVPAPGHVPGQVPGQGGVWHSWKSGGWRAGGQVPGPGPGSLDQAVMEKV